MGTDDGTPTSGLQNGRVMCKAAGSPRRGGPRDAPVACDGARDRGMSGARTFKRVIQRQFRRNMRRPQCEGYS